jgi:hypothetical protein
MSVLDWEDGPLSAVREAFSRALPADDAARGKLDSRSGPRRYSEVFGEFNKRAQRRPLLILDQFDDFQAEPRHRDRFLPGDTQVWRSATAIAQDNAFWRMLRQCMQNDTASVIVACREDAAGARQFTISPRHTAIQSTAFGAWTCSNDYRSSDRSAVRQASGGR